MRNKPSLQDLLHELAEERGLDLRGYKTGSLERRLRKRLDQLHLRDYGAYQEYLRANPSEVNDLLSTVLINVTEFFRDPTAWETLRQDAFPRMLHGLRPGGSLRAWCAGCATGEEVYTLAILLAEHLGPRLNDYEIKLYATDNDEQALAAARRAQYPAEQLQRVPARLREKYFNGAGTLRVNRELRRLCIFGRSNLVSDAAISHVRLLVCRNVLIYFDIALQRQVLERFRQALEPGGTLFLGKSESQLQGSRVWRPVSSKWRIFQRGKGDRQRRAEARDAQVSGQGAVAETPQRDEDSDTLRIYQKHLLDTLRPGVVILDAKNTVASGNDAALALWGIGDNVRLVGLQIEQTPLVKRFPEISRSLAMTQTGNETRRFETTVESREGEHKLLAVTVRPMLDDDGKRTGTLIYAEDITTQEKLRDAIEELESTAEDLNGANEELETTNEELQSANEELETTNEELQSTNEELETTNEELQSLNEELETSNTELDVRSRELDSLNEHFSQTLSEMPMPAAILNHEMRVELWNQEAEKLFGLGGKVVIGLGLKELPIQARLKKALLRRAEAALITKEPRRLRNQSLQTPAFSGVLDIHFTPLYGGVSRGVMLWFELFRAGTITSVRTRAAHAGRGGSTDGTWTKRTSSRRRPGRRTPSRKKRK